MNIYKPNHKLYIRLIIVAVILVGVSFFISVNSRWFAVLTGLGCGGATSILVAWLIDKASCRQKNLTTKNIFSKLFQKFDVDTAYVLNAILSSYAARNEDFDLDKKYSVTQIVELAESGDEKLPEWQRYFKIMRTAFSSINASAFLSYEPAEIHTRLYEVVTRAQIMHNEYAALLQKSKNEKKEQKKEEGVEETKETIEIKEEEFPIYEYFLLCTDLKTIESIHELRNKNDQYEISPEDKEEILKKREESKKEENTPTAQADTEQE